MGLRNDKKSEIFILITLFGLAPKNPWLTMVMVKRNTNLFETSYV